jgi:cytochrome c553
VRKLVLAGAIGALVINIMNAAGPASAASSTVRFEQCISCHGVKGQSDNPETPSLGGQPENYLLTQMFTFREKLRKSDLMNEMAKDLTDDDLRTYSVALAKLPPPPPEAAPADPAKMERAKALVVQGKCNICHQADFAGGDQVPRISAQREDYLLKALRDYKSGARVGYDPAMIEVMRTITEEHIVDLSHYLARRP